MTIVELTLPVAATDWLTASFGLLGVAVGGAVVTGTLVFGNSNSLKALDQNFFVVQSQQVSPGGQGEGTPPAGLSTTTAFSQCRRTSAAMRRNALWES